MNTPINQQDDPLKRRGENLNEPAFAPGTLGESLGEESRRIANELNARNNERLNDPDKFDAWLREGGSLK